MGSSATTTMPENALSELISKASTRKSPGCSYQGEILPVEAFDYLVREGGMLVDVRTVPEWQFVGVPDLTGCRGQLALQSWKVYPDMTVNPEFVEKMAAAGVDADTPLFFMCRGGGRSSQAASAICDSLSL